jgi:triosephosphate isomerase
LEFIWNLVIDYWGFDFYMRTPIIAGNWKMNKTVQEAKEMVSSLLPMIVNEEVEVVLAPPFTALYVVGDLIRGTKVKLGAQDIFWEDKGAYTGEVSPLMLLDVGCSYVIIGHSERREHFGETNNSVNKKIMASLRNGLKPILCIGETLEQREKGTTFDILGNELTEGLRGLSPEELNKIVIAYEPIWAIGTGKTAKPEEANEAHRFVRGWIKDNFGMEVSSALRIMYGGSVTPENIDALMSQIEIDGALVGGASLKAEGFARIVNYRR